MVVYEIAKFPFPTDGIIMFCIVVGIALFVFDYGTTFYQTKKWRYLFLSVGFFLLLVISFCFFVNEVRGGGSDEYEYAKKYYDGDYQIVSGKVEKYHVENVNGVIRKNFYVDNVYLEQNYSALNWNEMFHKEKTICKNGQNVEICYVIDKDDYETGKVIVKITLLDD